MSLRSRSRQSELPASGASISLGFSPIVHLEQTCRDSRMIAAPAILREERKQQEAPSLSALPSLPDQRILSSCRLGSRSILST